MRKNVKKIAVERTPVHAILNGQIVQQGKMTFLIYTDTDKFTKFLKGQIL